MLPFARFFIFIITFALTKSMHASCIVNSTLITKNSTRMKRIALVFFLLAGIAFSASAQSLTVFIYDTDGPYTNIRNAPKGKVVGKLPTNSDAMFNVVKCVNGWWQINKGEYWQPDDETGKLKGSTTGYWVHKSCIAVSTRNYGGQKLLLRNTPSHQGALSYSFKDETMLRPIDIKGDWIKVQTFDGKHAGWIESEWLCGNSVTNCN